MNESEARLKIQNDPNFIHSKRFDYSIDKLELKYPDGCPDHVIADVLMLSEEELEAEMGKIVVKLRDVMGVRL